MSSSQERVVPNHSKDHLVYWWQWLALRGNKDDSVIDSGTDYFAVLNIWCENLNALLLLQLSSGDGSPKKHFTVSTPLKNVELRTERIIAAV